jgi:succinyl-CoA synthetase beta subunit
MNIHEYQAKQVLEKYGVFVPKGKIAFTVNEAAKAAEELSPPKWAEHSPVWVVKAQIHAGGRGKAGGVKVCKSVDEVRKEADRMLGMTLVTPQTGPEGKVVRKVYIEEGSNIAKEYYLSAVLDRETASIVFIASTEGGMEIEEVAESNPEKIIRVTVDPTIGLMPFHMRKIAVGLGFEGDKAKMLFKMVKAIYDAFVATDANQIEINPLIETKDGEIMALDAKMNFDENGLYRHPSIAELRDPDEEDPLETEAKKFDLSYVKMEGNIGCMVNGAGLAMATMDIIKTNGGEPANFLDVGGGADVAKVTEAFKLILSDPGVKGILVNIFGGIMRCDIIAEGVIAATKKVGVNVPIVVRLSGTNADKGKKLLEESGLDLIPADDLDDAASKIMNEIKKASEAA